MFIGLNILYAAEHLCSHKNTNYAIEDVNNIINKYIIYRQRLPWQSHVSPLDNMYLGCVLPSTANYVYIPKTI